MKYLEVSAVARRLNVSTSTVYRLIKQKKLIVSKNGVSAGIRVIKDSVVDFEKYGTEWQTIENKCQHR